MRFHFGPATRRLSALFILCASICCAALAQSYPPAWNSSASYAVGDQVQENGDVYRCTVAATPNHNPATAYQNWELHEVRANTSLMIGIGQTFPSLAVAWKYALNATIDQGAFLHLVVSTTNGIYRETFNGTMNLDHPFGASISLIGDNNSRVFFTSPFAASVGIQVDSGHAIGALSNFSLIGSNGGGIGILATTNAAIANVSGVGVDFFYDSFEANMGGVINCASTIRFVTPQRMFHAATNGAITVASGFTTTVSCLSAFYAETGGTIFVVEANLTGETDNGNGAAYATDGGLIYIVDSQITSWRFGIQAYEGGRVIADGTSISMSGVDDIIVAGDSFVSASATDYTTTSVAADGSQLYTP